VAGQILDHAQIRAVLQQLRRNAVPQHARRHIPLHAGTPDAIFDVQPQRYRRKLRATTGQYTFAGDVGVTSFGHPTAM
jgi:hypothetical protein